jgi:hypothetical protein
MSDIALLEQTPVPTDVVGSDYHKCIGREGALVSSDLCFGESAPALRKPEAWDQTGSCRRAKLEKLAPIDSHRLSTGGHGLPFVD